MEGTFKAIELMSKQNGGNGGLVVNIGSAAGNYFIDMIIIVTCILFKKKL